MLWLRWATEWWKAYKKQTRCQKGDRRRPAKPPPDGKVNLTGMKFQLFRSQVSECSYLSSVQTGPLYRDPGDGYLSNNLPKICGSQ